MTREDAMRKIQALLATAGDKCNEHESRDAMLMAQKMMAKYEIAERELLGSKKVDIKIITAYSSQKSNTPWARSLARIIATNFGVLLYSSSIGKTLYPAFFGEEEKAEIAKTVYDFALPWLTKNSANYATRMRNTKGIVKGVKQDYILGFLKGLEEQYKAQVERETAENKSYALVLTVPTAVTDAYGNLGLVTKTHSGRMNVHGSTEARNAGYRDGLTYGRAIEG